MAERQTSEDFRNQWVDYIHGLQDRICQAVAGEDGLAVFRTDAWQRSEGGGGGRTRVLEQGQVFEKGGVNTSVVFGEVTEAMRSQLKLEGTRWFAAGLSLILHPDHPFVPAVHANWRYFELYDAAGNIADRWMGGGADLTPSYLITEDAVHFHGTLKKAMDPFGMDLYPAYKKWCDHYFNNAHRGFEMRGIGGVFYDHLRPSGAWDPDRLFRFQKSVADQFLEAYLPIVNRRKTLPFTPQNKYWQEIRRGRYVEFNLIHDRGTLFGLKTNGRTESILMSLPPTVRFDYDFQPADGSEEWKLLEACRHPRDWV